MLLLHRISAASGGELAGVADARTRASGNVVRGGDADEVANFDAVVGRRQTADRLRRGRGGRYRCRRVRGNGRGCGPVSDAYVYAVKFRAADRQAHGGSSCGAAVEALRSRASYGVGVGSFVLLLLHRISAASGRELAGVADARTRASGNVVRGGDAYEVANFDAVIGRRQSAGRGRCVCRGRRRGRRVCDADRFGRDHVVVGSAYQTDVCVAGIAAVERVGQRVSRLIVDGLI